MIAISDSWSDDESRAGDLSTISEEADLFFDRLNDSNLFDALDDKESNLTDENKITEDD